MGFAGIIVDTVHTPMSLVESWSNLRATNGGLWMTEESSTVGSSNSNGIEEMANCSGHDLDDSQLTRRKVGGENWNRAPHLGADRRACRFLLSSFEVGQDGKRACERLNGKSAKVHGMNFLGRNPVEKKTCWRSARKTHLHVYQGCTRETQKKYRQRTVESRSV